MRDFPAATKVLKEKGNIKGWCPGAELFFLGISVTCGKGDLEGFRMIWGRSVYCGPHRVSFCHLANAEEVIWSTARLRGLLAEFIIFGAFIFGLRTDGNFELILPVIPPVLK